jgi:hypothetical protein
MLDVVILSAIIPSVVKLNVMRGASTTTKARENNKYHWNPQNFFKNIMNVFLNFILKTDLFWQIGQ